MNDNTVLKTEGFYQRITRLRDETAALQDKTYERLIKLTDAFNTATASGQIKIKKQLQAIDSENRRLRDLSYDLAALERNPPWRELSEQLFNANYAKVEELTRDGKMIKLMNKERVSVLGQPAYAGDEKILELLIARGAEVNIAGHDNLTPLLFSVMKDNAGVFKNR